MFEFFEGMIEKIGVKLITNFTEKLIDFIADIKKNTETNNGLYELFYSLFKKGI